MNSITQNNPKPWGRIFGMSALGLVLGALVPVMTLLEVFLLCPVLLAGGIFLVFLQCTCGWIPALVFILSQLAATWWLLGPVMMAMDFVAAVCPAVILCVAIGRGRAFFRQMRVTLCACCIGMLAAICIAYTAFGAGMIQKFVDQIRAQFDQMSDFALLPFVDMINAALTPRGQTGISITEYRSSLKGLLDIVQQTYGQMLPGTLLSGALITAALMVLWGNWRMACRGLATAESFAGMGLWYIPRQLTVGLLVLWIASYLASGSSANGAAVYATVYQLVCYAFVFQALGAMERRYHDHGMRLSGRRVIIALALILSLFSRTIAQALMLVGIASALFGRHGVFRPKPDSDMGGSDGNDDNEDVEKDDDRDNFNSHDSEP